MRAAAALLLAVGVAGFAVYVALQNGDPVRVDLAVHTFQGPSLGVALLVAFVSGAAISAGVFAVSALRLRIRLHGLRRQIAKLERELHGLRTLPLQEAGSHEGARAGEA
ncbi:MAG: lipopolysaccharide assembly LapA domain-containing protein [Myxococcota bacterium]